MVARVWPFEIQIVECSLLEDIWKDILQMIKNSTQMAKTNLLKWQYGKSDWLNDFWHRYIQVSLGSLCKILFHWMIFGISTYKSLSDLCSRTWIHVFSGVHGSMLYKRLTTWKWCHSTYFGNISILSSISMSL